VGCRETVLRCAVRAKSCSVNGLLLRCDISEDGARCGRRRGENSKSQLFLPLCTTTTGVLYVNQIPPIAVSPLTPRESERRDEGPFHIA